ncbi:MAG: hypothetical protein OXP10_03460 [Chloroflexota bacterium]|nr:hypothetical protein [Chloroflexota bacterium]
MMESTSLLEDLRALPISDDAAGYSHETAVSKLRGTDKDTFALGVAEAAEEAMDALFEGREVPNSDLLNEAYRLAFTEDSQTTSLADYFAEISERGERSVIGFVSSLKGKVAELESVRQLEEMHPGYKFEIPANPNQPVYDLIGRGPEGTEDIFVQVKAGGLGYAGDVMERMEEAPGHVQFAVSSELYDKLMEVDPDSAGRLVDTGIEIGEFTEDIKSGLGTLASNSGIDVPDSIGELLPYVGDIVLGIRLISQMVSTEGELRGVEVTERSRIHAIRALTMMSRFGVTQVCAWAGGRGRRCGRQRNPRTRHCGWRSGGCNRWCRGSHYAEPPAGASHGGRGHQDHGRRPRRGALPDEQVRR